MIGTKSSVAPGASRLRFRHACERRPYQLRRHVCHEAELHQLANARREHDNLIDRPLSDPFLCCAN